VPEFYSSKFSVGKDSFAFNGLKMLERCSAAFSDHVIIANHLWEKVITSRSVAKDKCSTYLNYPDSRMFNNARRTRKDDGRFIMIYPGTLNWHQGLDIAIKAFDRIKEKAPHAEFHIYGSGNYKDDLLLIIKELSLSNRVKLMDTVPIEQIGEIMANADLGVVPRERLIWRRCIQHEDIRIHGARVPVIVANTRIDKYYFNESLVKYFEAGDEISLAGAMLS